MSQRKVPQGQPKPVSFNGWADSYVCLVCSKPSDPADSHVLREEPDGHYYSGISFHAKCFDIEAAIRAERDLANADRG